MTTPATQDPQDRAVNPCGSDPECDDPVELNSARGRWLLTAAALGTGMAFLDGTVVNVAVRQIGTDLNASLAELQWVVNAYLLALASLILVGGSLGDRLGRRRMFTIGVVWFALASAACALAPNPETLIAGRAVQGIGAALLTPGSLAMMQGSFRPQDRARAIGMWSGLAGVSTMLGPFLGGGLVQSVGWPYVFWINVPIALAIVVITVRYVPESRDPQAATHFDILGATLGAAGLGAVTYALIEAGTRPASTITIAAVIGIVALVAFVVSQRRLTNPMIPLAIFSSRVFNASNLLTLLVYGALGALTFLLVLQLQVVAGYDPLLAGLATLPITIVMLFLSGRSAALASRIGPRPQMTVGPILCAGDRDLHDHAVRPLRSAVAGFRAAGHRHGHGLAMRHLANVHRLRGEIAAARRCGAEARDLLHSVGDPIGEAHMLSRLALLENEHGDAARARVLVDRALALVREVGYQRGVAQSLHVSASVYARAGDFDRARLMLFDVLEIVHEVDDVVGAPHVLLALGRTERRAGRPRAAVRYLRRSAELAERLGLTRMAGQTNRQIEEIVADG